ncbi:WD repeat protein [Pyronema domesticum]|nr:WD repeat protein [Pyronema domesticum]
MPQMSPTPTYRDTSLPPSSPTLPPSSPALPGSKTPSSANAVHPFFTPRRRHARHPLSTISNLNNRAARIHLLSPDESPSNRRSKRARFSPSASSNPPSSPIRGASRWAGWEPEEAVEEQPEIKELVLPLRKKRVPVDLNRRTWMRSLYGGREYGNCVDWSLDPLRFYSRPEDQQPILLENSSEQTIPFCAAACNRSSLVAVGDESGSVRLIETALDESPGFITPYLVFPCHDNAIFDMSWSPDDIQIATCSGDQTCRVFDVTQRRQLNILRHHQNSVKQIRYNIDNPSLLASSARDGILNIWDLRVFGRKESEGRDIVTVLQPVCSVPGAHQSGRKSNSVTSIAWLTEHTIASAGESDAVIKLWDLRSTYIRRKKPIPVEQSALPVHHSLPGHRNFGINSLTTSPDRQRVYAVCKDSNVYAYSTRHLQQGPRHAYSHPRLHAETFYVKSDISRDGCFLATGSSDGVAIVFPTDEKLLEKGNQETFLWKGEEIELARHMRVGRGVALMRGHEKEVTDLSWTMGGELVTLGDDYRARCWRMGGDTAEGLRESGEEGGRRWGWGWADMVGRGLKDL